MTEIRMGIAGVGCCASALVQGLMYYRESSGPGLANDEMGGYRIQDLRVVTAFDVAEGKVGLDLAAALEAPPNNTLHFAGVPHAGVTVLRGPTLDGLGRSLRSLVREHPSSPVNVAKALRGDGVDVLLNYLPVGSQKASEHYANAAAEAGCAFVNCMPAPVVSDPKWAARFQEAGVAAVGDDVKSQLGATVLHRTLLELLGRRGVRVDRTYQMNFGGNADFLNMQDVERLVEKRASKVGALQSAMRSPLPGPDIEAGPAGYVPWLEDRKICDIVVEATGFGGAPVRLGARLEVWDSPNSAGVVVDAVRCAKVAMDRGEAGPLEWASACYMKRPLRPHSEEEAWRGLRRWVAGAES